MKQTLAVLLVAVCVAAGALSVGVSAQRRGRAGGADPQGRGRARGDLTGTPALKHEVKDAARKKAVCNDGSPAAFYLRPGKDPDRNKWIVFLQGGGACGTDHDCSTRWKDEHNLMTSVGLPMRRQEPGFLSDDEKENPDFARFTLVMVHYCSSDTYAGDGERTVDGRLLQFRGHRIIDAVLDDLMDRSIVGTPTLGEATEVLFAGTSAGAMGMHNNLDRVAGRLSWARMKGLSDSGWAADMQPFGPGTLEVRPDGAALIQYSNAQPDESCVAANPNQKGRCLAVPFLFPYLKTPMFVYADQQDPVHLGTYGIMGRTTSPQQQDYVREYGRILREELEKVPAVFSPSINVHTSLGTERFHSVSIEGHDLAETIGNWYFGRPGPMHLISPASTETGRTRGARGGNGRAGRGGRAGR
jgi:hypothetical protein